MEIAGTVLYYMEFQNSLSWGPYLNNPENNENGKIDEKYIGKGSSFSAILEIIGLIPMVIVNFFEIIGLLGLASPFTIFIQNILGFFLTLFVTVLSGVNDILDQYIFPLAP